MLKVTVGSVQVVALVDNIVPYPFEAVYRGSDAALAAARGYAIEGNVVMNFGCFLIRDGGTTTLVDTGWGPENGGKLLEELDAAGIHRDEVDVVTFTHLHGDHTGWTLDRAGGWPLFPRARYLVPRKDWDHYAAARPAPESYTRDVAPLAAAGVMDLFEGERTFSPSLTSVETPGHTPGHTSFVIVSGGERGYVLGDVVLGDADAADPALENTFDWDSGIAGVTRKRVIAQLVADGSLVGGSHLPPPGLGRFVRVDGGTGWQGYTTGG